MVELMIEGCVASVAYGNLVLLLLSSMGSMQSGFATAVARQLGNSHVACYNRPQVTESRRWGKGLGKPEFVQRRFPGESYPGDCGSRMVTPFERPSDEQARPTNSSTGGKAQGKVRPAKCLGVRDEWELALFEHLWSVGTGGFVCSTLGKLLPLAGGDCGSRPGARTRPRTAVKEQLERFRNVSMHNTNKGHLSGVRCGSSRGSLRRRVCQTQTEECGLSRSHWKRIAISSDSGAGERLPVAIPFTTGWQTGLPGATKGPTASF